MSTETHRESRTSFFGVLRGEAISLSGVRATWWLIILSVAVPLLVITVWALNATPASTDAVAQADAVIGSVTSSVFETLVLFVLFGALAGTRPYETRTITIILAAVPRRWPVFAAKALLVGVGSLVVGLVVLTLGFFIAAAIVPTETAVSLNTPGVVGAIVGTALFQTSAAIISLCLATILRSSIGAIASTFGFAYVVPGALGLISLPPVTFLASTFPGPASQTLMSLAVPPSSLPYGPAAVAIIVWTALWIAAAIVTLQRRDV